MVNPPTQPLPEYTDVLIVGGGPSGIVALKYALAEGWSAVLAETESEIGGTFRWRAYENAELVSSKQLTCFSDFRYPLSAPDHPSLPDFVGYLHDYASHFDLWPSIHLTMRVTRLECTGSAAHPHRATLERGGGGQRHVVCATRVIVTTGLHVTPNIPTIPGLTVKRTPASPAFIHSSAYTSRSQVRDKDVLVLGCGETGMDVAYESVLSDARVWLGVRSGFLSFPKVLNNFRVLGATFDGNLPIDGLITNLFETAYVHPWVAASHLRWFVSDAVIRGVLWALTGTTAGCNQWAGELPRERQGRAYVFLNKSARAMQFINAPHFRLSRLHQWFAHYIDPPLPTVRQPSIDVVPFPTRFEDGRAMFPPPPEHRRNETAWQRECRPDLVVLCTGYRQEWDWMDSSYATPDRCDVRGICRSDDLSVAFIGFLRPGVGAIPPMAEMQAQLFMQLTTARVPVPSSPETYHLLHSPTARIQYGVDYSTYMAQLARDMGAAPGLRQLWRAHGAFVVFVYCFGAAFPTFYRLTGPYRSDAAREIVCTELWDTIRRRGVIGNIFMGVIPMAFYALINLCAAVAEFAYVRAASVVGIKAGESQVDKYLRERRVRIKAA
ncbi:hypothetical protein Q5752_003257 [Cryptotrichosporon argae]